MQYTLTNYGYNVQLKNETEFKKEHADHADLVVAFGGDHTYLDAQSKVNDPYKTAFLGINSHPEH